MQTKAQIEVVGIVPYTRATCSIKIQTARSIFPLPAVSRATFSFTSNSRPTPAAIPARPRISFVAPCAKSMPPFRCLSLKTFAQHLDGNIELWIVRAGAALFSIFGGLALALATVGVYGVKAYSVARRTREIGIRMALGAQRETVQWMILREGAVMLASGVLLGLLLAAATGKLVSGMLYNVGALDPLAFTIAPIVLPRRRYSRHGCPRAARRESARWLRSARNRF